MPPDMYTATMAVQRLAAQTNRALIQGYSLQDILAIFSEKEDAFSGITFGIFRTRSVACNQQKRASETTVQTESDIAGFRCIRHFVTG